MASPLHRPMHCATRADKVLATVARVGLRVLDEVMARGEEHHDAHRIALSSMVRWCRGEDNAAVLGARRKAFRAARSEEAIYDTPKVWARAGIMVAGLLDVRDDVLAHPTHINTSGTRTVSSCAAVLESMGEPRDAAKARVRAWWDAILAEELGERPRTKSQEATAALDAMEVFRG